MFKKLKVMAKEEPLLFRASILVSIFTAIFGTIAPISLLFTMFHLEITLETMKWSSFLAIIFLPINFLVGWKIFNGIHTLHASMAKEMPNFLPQKGDCHV